jgi:hypothetical protein
MKHSRLLRQNPGSDCAIINQKPRAPILHKNHLDSMVIDLKRSEDSFLVLGSLFVKEEMVQVLMNFGSTEIERHYSASDNMICNR